MLRVEAKTQEDNIIVLLTGCFCIGPGIDSRLAVLAPRANTADRDSQFVTFLLNNRGRNAGLNIARKGGYFAHLHI